MKRSCDFTKYPKLFGTTYWGSYTKLHKHNYPNEEIIGENRNYTRDTFKMPVFFYKNLYLKRYS